MPGAGAAVGATVAGRKARRRPARAVDHCLGKLGTAAARELMPETVYSYDGRHWWRREPDLGVAVELTPALLVADLERVADREWSGGDREAADRHQPLAAALDRLAGPGGVARETLTPCMLAAYKDLESPLWPSIRAECRRNRRALGTDTLKLATRAGIGE